MVSTTGMLLGLDAEGGQARFAGTYVEYLVVIKVKKFIISSWYSIPEIYSVPQDTHGTNEQ